MKGGGGTRPSRVGGSGIGSANHKGTQGSGTQGCPAKGTQGSGKSGPGGSKGTQGRG